MRTLPPPGFAPGIDTAIHLRNWDGTATLSVSIVIVSPQINRRSLKQTGSLTGTSGGSPFRATVT